MDEVELGAILGSHEARLQALEGTVEEHDETLDQVEDQAEAAQSLAIDALVQEAPSVDVEEVIAIAADVAADVAEAVAEEVAEEVSVEVAEEVSEEVAEEVSEEVAGEPAADGGEAPPAGDSSDEVVPAEEPAPTARRRRGSSLYGRRS